MIGLPTKTSSRMWSGSIAGLRGQRRSTRSAEGVAHGRGHLGRAAGVHHGEGDPAHQILAEADLRVHDAGRGQHIAPLEVARWAAMVVEPMSMATPRARSWKPGQMAMTCFAAWTATVTL